MLAETMWDGSRRIREVRSAHKKRWRGTCSETGAVGPEMDIFYAQFMVPSEMCVDGEIDVEIVIRPRSVSYPRHVFTEVTDD